MFSTEEAWELLDKAGVFYPLDDDNEDRQTLNMNDTWGWACAMGEVVPDEALIEVATLFWRYGWCGLLYWVSERNGQMKSEFHDVNRFVEFVRHEEEICAQVPDSSARAYEKREYTIGT